MKIAIVHENWGAGAARCARDLEAGLGKNHEVLFFPRTEEPETEQSVLAGLKAFRPDVVSCHSFYGGLPYGVLQKIANLYPVCFTVHDTRPVGAMDPTCYTCDRNRSCLRCPLVPSRWQKLFSNPYFKSRITKRICHLRCPRGMKVVTPSRWLADRLKQQELSRFDVSTVPNGIDTDRFAQGVRSRQRFGLPEDATVILHSAWHLGRWKPNAPKGLHLLAQAMDEHVWPFHDSVILAVAGEGLAPNHPNVRPIGMVEHQHLQDLLASVDVFVSPTLADNFPYTVIEAMAAGKPVIASDVGGIPEQVVEGQTGRLVPPGDTTSLGVAIKEMIADREQLNALGLAGQSRANELFSMEMFLTTYNQILLDLVP